MKKDIMSVLPDGSEFVSWEMPCSYDTVIHVNPAHKMSADNNDGSSEAPLKPFFLVPLLQPEDEHIRDKYGLDNGRNRR